MALVMSNGFLRDENGRLAVTTSTTDATMRGGFLRAPDGRLVVKHV